MSTPKLQLNNQLSLSFLFVLLTSLLFTACQKEALQETHTEKTTEITDVSNTELRQ